MPSLVWAELARQLGASEQVPWDTLKHYILTSVGGFCALHWVSGRVFRSLLGHAVYANFRNSDRLALAEKICSTAHAITVGVSALHMILVQRAFARDVIHTYPEGLDRTFCISIGYQIYDMLIMALQATDPVTMWVHHGLTLAGLALMTVYRVGAWAPLVFLVSELTVPFANFDWYCKKLGLRDSLYFVNLRLMVLSYYLFRLFIGPLDVGYMIYRGQLGQFLSLPKVVSVASMFNILVISRMNVQWTRKLQRRLSLPRPVTRPHQG